MKLSASVLAGVVPAETPKRKASVAPISLSDAFSSVTFRAKAASSVDDAVSYAESHGLAGDRIQAELIAAGVKQAGEEFNPANNQEEREEAKAKETPDFALQQPELDTPHPPLPPLRLSGSLRALASAFPVGSTAYSLKTGSAMKVVASNLVGDDMLIIRAKTASGVERHVVSSQHGLQVVPSSLRRLFAALKEAAGTYFDLYVKTALREAGLPVDESMNWDGLLMKVYRKYNWTKDTDLLEQAIYDMLTQMLYAPGTGNGAKGLTVLEKFNPAKGDEALPLEKQISNYLMSRFLPYNGKPSAGSDLVRRSIDKHQREITENQIGDGTGDPLDTAWDDSTAPKPDEVGGSGVAGMAVDSIRKAFASYLSRKVKGTGASRILTLFDIYVDNPHKGDAASADALEEWEAATGTGKQNFYQTRRALANAISAFANSDGAPAGEGFRALVNALKGQANEPVPVKSSVSVEASDITPDNIVMPDIDQKEADMRPTIRERHP